MSSLSCSSLVFLLLSLWFSVCLLNIVKFLQDAILLWMYDPATRDAILVKNAIYGETSTLRAATEVICSRTPSQIQHFKQIYLTIFRSPLERDIERTATGDHQKVLLPFLLLYHSHSLLSTSFWWYCSVTWF